MIPYSPFRDYSLAGFHIGVEPVAMIVALIVFVILVIKGLEKQKTGMSVKEYFVFFSILVLSALAGGRIWYFAAHWSGPQNIMLFFNPFKAGMVSLGVFIGGALGAIVYTLTSAKKTDKNWSLEFAKIADTIVAPTALALFIYRLLGCTIKGDIVGAPTLLPWCFKWTDGVCRHPASVYLALSNLFIFIALKVFFGREKRAKGLTEKPIKAAYRNREV